MRDRDHVVCKTTKKIKVRDIEIMLYVKQQRNLSEKQRSCCM